MAEKQSSERSDNDQPQLTGLSEVFLLASLFRDIMSSVPLARAKKRENLSECFLKSNGNIAAIDFGTTSVTLAYTTHGDNTVSSLILDEFKIDTRTPNSILLQKDNDSFKVVSFGHHACNQYVKLRPSERDSHVYFERIKMLLKRDQNISRQTTVTSFDGQRFYLIEVIAFILKYLKDHLIDHLSRTITPLKTTDFDWVITVPAIWDARGKRMMREAAYLAGLLTEGPGITTLTPTDVSISRPLELNPDKLSLALEPEAAAIYSQSITSKEAPGSVELKGAYMVVDIGGGTVDITVQEEIDGGIEVKSIPTGNSCGGTEVNELFSKFIQNLVQDTNFSRFRQSGEEINVHGVINKLIYQEFEGMKLQFGTKKLKPSEDMCILLPNELIEFYTKESIEKQAKSLAGVDFEDDTLYIPYNIAESSFFEPIVKDIINSVISVFESVNEKIETVYLVGGFGGCKYIHERLQDGLVKRFHSIDCRIIVPTSPKLAIAQGAVMWRRDPSVIKARRADATYGTAVAQPFNPLVHDLHYCGAHKETNEVFCLDIFDIFIEKGEIVKSNEVFVSEIATGATSAVLNILSCQERGVRYVKDKEGKPTVTKVGELVIDTPNPDNLPVHERKVEVSMMFSETEIQAKAKYLLTGEEVKTVCDFLSAQKE